MWKVFNAASRDSALFFNQFYKTCFNVVANVQPIYLNIHSIVQDLNKKNKKKQDNYIVH